MSYADIPFERAIVNATAAPARLLGLERELGRIAEGMRADFALWDSELRVVATVVGGRPIFGGNHLKKRRTAEHRRLRSPLAGTCSKVHAEKGFTLVETTIGVAILVLLAAGAVGASISSARIVRTPHDRDLMLVQVRSAIVEGIGAATAYDPARRERDSETDGRRPGTPPAGTGPATISTTIENGAVIFTAAAGGETVPDAVSGRHRSAPARRDRGRAGEHHPDSLMLAYVLFLAAIAALSRPERYWKAAWRSHAWWPAKPPSVTRRPDSHKREPTSLLRWPANCARETLFRRRIRCRQRRLCAGDARCPFSISASYALAGATGQGGSANAVAVDLQTHPAIAEGRVAATIVETVAAADGTPMAVRNEYVTLRTLSVPPYAMIEGTSDGAGARDVPTQADAAGCDPGNVRACDTNNYSNVQPAGGAAGVMDPADTRIHALVRCTDGGSGACAGRTYVSADPPGAPVATGWHNAGADPREWSR